MKKIYVFMLMLLLIGQTILGPMGTVSAKEIGKPAFSLKELLVTDENGEAFSEENPPSAKSTIHLEYGWSGLQEESEQEISVPILIPDGLIAIDSGGALISDSGTSTGSYVLNGNEMFITLDGHSIVPEEHPDVSDGQHTGGAKPESETQPENGAEPEGETQPENGAEAEGETQPENGAEPESETQPENGAEPEGETQPENGAEPDGETQSESGTELEVDEQPKSVNQSVSRAVSGTFTIKTKMAEDANGFVFGKKTFTIGEESSNDGGSITENILKDAVITVFENESSNAEMEYITLESIINVKYNWALDERHGYEGGSTFSFTLPPELKVYEEIVNAPIYFDSQEIGTFSVSNDGNATMVFNSFIKEHSKISGTLEVETRIDETITMTDEKMITITPIEGGESVEIPFIYQHTGSTIDKKGVPNQEYNGDSITWTVDFNKAMTSITNAVLEDIIQDGQELIPDSIELYKVISRLDGTIINEESVSNLTIGQVEGKDFKLDLGDISSLYRLTYQTKITDLDQTKFENLAKLTGIGIEDATATASVSINRGKSLEKKSAKYDKDTQTITWEINYNYNEKTIPQARAKLIDEFSESQKLVGDITVEKVTIKDDGTESERESVSNYTVEKVDNGFTLQFNSDISEAYKITYQTTAKKRVFDGMTVNNKVVSGTDEEKEADRKIEQHILYKSNLKSDTDYKSKTTKWEIKFNNDSYPMENVVLTDDFTNKGLTLKPETLKITNKDRVLVAGQDYQLAVNDDSNGFVITFDKDIIITLPHVIEYETTFNYDARENKEKRYLENKATLTWVDQDGDNKEKIATDNFTPDTYTQSNGFKSGSYDAATKEITWEVGVNYNLRNLNDASVVDYILDGQQLVEGSIKIYEIELSGKENGIEVKREEITDINIDETLEDEDQNPGFKVSLGNIEKAYLIQYKTSLANQQIKSTYNNIARLFDGDVEEHKLSASVTIPHGGEYVKKSGSQNKNEVNWTVGINYSQSSIKDFKILDTPSNNQFIKEDSFKIYETNVDEKGNVKSSGKEFKDYTVKFDENTDGIITSFTLTFTGTIDKPYILEYDSIILAKPGDEIKNDIEYTGDEITEEMRSVSSKFKVVRTTGSATGEGYTGSLTIIKVDESDPLKPLKGAKFTLVDLLTEEIVDTGETDETGKLSFTRLLFGKYQLTETEAPAGYLLNVNNSQEVVITKEKEVTVKNEKATQAVKLKKVDLDDPNKVLPGAVFDLLKKGVGEDYDPVKENLTTNEHGLIVLNELEPGHYQFVEVTAPKWYELDKEPVSFTIERNAHSIVTKEKKNKYFKGNLKIIKIDADNKDELLKGAEFDLLNSEGNTIRSGKTDESGQLEFKDIPYGEYRLVETKAPDGYVLVGVEGIEMTIDSESDTIPIKNHKINRSVQLTKYNANKTLVLPNAEFELRKMDASLPEGYEVVTTIDPEKLVTDENGTIYLEELEPGEYQFVETKAPSGYYVNNEPESFTITTNQTSTVPVEKTNNRIPDPVWPGPVEPGKPVDPDKPKPGEEDPNDPNKPGEPGEENPNDPDKPGNPGEEDPNDPNKPGQPGEEDPNDPNNPGQPGEENPNDPNKPTDPSTTDPTDSNKPGTNKPSTPGNNGSVEGQAGNKGNATGMPGPAGGSKGQQVNASGKDTLPQTGEELYLYMTIFGFVLILAGGFMVRRRKINE